MFNQVWYDSLTKPLFTPPSYVFTPVWIILYVTVFIALFLYIKTPAENKKEGYYYFAAQLILNLLWSPLFFCLMNIALAFVDIILLDIFTILTMRKFYSVFKASAIILVPYMIWIIFATYLNFAYLVLNNFW